MAEDTLKRLLDAELRAQELVDEAIAERDRLTAQARDEAQSAEQRFEKRIPGLHASFRDKSAQRAEQTIAALQKRRQEKQTELERLADERMHEAVDEALKVVLTPEQDG